MTTITTPMVFNIVGRFV